jgi:uncharacterized protein YegP (UPF0339 family)
MTSFVLWRTGREWTFRLVGDDGESILKGGLHSIREFALRTIEAIRFQSQDPGAYEAFQTAAARHGFKLKESDGRTIAASSFYSSPERRDRVMEECQRIESIAQVIERTAAEDGHADTERAPHVR